MSWYAAHIIQMTKFLDGAFVPTNGTEITYSELQVESAEALAKLVNGEPALVLYEE